MFYLSLVFKNEVFVFGTEIEVTMDQVNQVRYRIRIVLTLVSGGIEWLMVLGRPLIVTVLDNTYNSQRK